MCKKCFENNIYRFENQSQFNEFEENFNLKDKFITIVNSTHTYLNDSHYVYNCENCKTVWWLSIPENAWRGYFLKEKEAKNHIEKMRKSDEKKKYGCFFIIFITILFIILFSFNKK